MKAESMYWIQDSNERGDNYCDSIGMPDANLEEARKQLKGWKREFPERQSRLILRTDTVIEGGQQ